MEPKTTMTPLMVEMLLHYYWSLTDHPQVNTEAGQDAMRFFINAGIFYERGVGQTNSSYGYYQDALDVYVNAILEVPLPTKVWIIK